MKKVCHCRTMVQRVLYNFSTLEALEGSQYSSCLAWASKIIPVLRTVCKGNCWIWRKQTAETKKKRRRVFLKFGLLREKQASKQLGFNSTSQSLEKRTGDDLRCILVEEGKRNQERKEALLGWVKYPKRNKKNLWPDFKKEGCFLRFLCIRSVTYQVEFVNRMSMAMLFSWRKLRVRLLLLLERRIQTFCAFEVLVALFC